MNFRFASNSCDGITVFKIIASNGFVSFLLFSSQRISWHGISKWLHDRWHWGIQDEVIGYKKNKKDFEKRYPGRGEQVMYATATKKAMEK